MLVWWAQLRTTLLLSRSPPHSLSLGLCKCLRGNERSAVARVYRIKVKFKASRCALITHTLPHTHTLARRCCTCPCVWHNNNNIVDAVVVVAATAVAAVGDAPASPLKSPALALCSSALPLSLSLHMHLHSHLQFCFCFSFCAALYSLAEAAFITSTWVEAGQTAITALAVAAVIRALLLLSVVCYCTLT